MDNKLIPAAIALGVLLLAFVGFDAGCGSRGNAMGRVTGKRYVPPWVETQIHTDSDGDVSVITIQHPERWVVEVNYGDQLVDVDTDHGQYEELQGNQKIIVRYREGKWTHAHYLKQIDPNLQSEN